MRAYERLLNYVNFWTTSDPENDTMPTSFRQFDLAHQLTYELKLMGVDNARINNDCFVYGSLEATPGYEHVTPIGFIAHMDTSPEFNGRYVHPQILENYNGEDVILGTSGRVLRILDFPRLKTLKGRTLITTDGTSLLGADDKAGIAEILTALETVIQDKRPHGKICVAFTPDEEVGTGISRFNLDEFGAKYAYTLDGWEEGEIVYENFNAASVVISINGKNMHTGRAKGVMINAQLIGIEINNLLPPDEIPSKTEGRQGFFHLLHFHGSVEYAQLIYNVREHSTELFCKRKELLCQIVKQMNETYGEHTVSIAINDVYYNMKEKIEPCFHIIENAQRAAGRAGIQPKIRVTRGGTDGASLSFMGLPCPNLGTGGQAFHGPYEHITIEGMDQVVRMLQELIAIYTEEQ